MSDANVVTIDGDLRGEVIKYVEQVEVWRKDKTLIRIDGECASACTLVLSLPREQVCLGPNGSLGFHKASGAWADANLSHAYSPDLTRWLDEQGGLKEDVSWARTATARRFVTPYEREERIPAIVRSNRDTPTC